jgi:hypothetical protein
VPHPVAARWRRAGAAPQRAQRHPGRSRIQPDAGIRSQTQPNEGSSTLPAGGPLVRGVLPGDSSSESRPGSRRSVSVSPARVACSSDPRCESDWTSVKPTRDARSKARAAFSKRASMRPPSSIPDSGKLPGTAFSYTLASLNGGDCQLPLEPRGLAKNRCPRQSLRRRGSTHRHFTGEVYGADPRKGGCFEGGFWYLWL